MRIEHLIAGTRERGFGRAHRPEEIPGFTGKSRRRVGHGQAYPSSITGLTEYHGLTDNLTARHHERLIKAAKRRIQRKNVLFQSMGPEYRRPPAGE